MDKGRKETLHVRVISITFTVLALAIFKPFGLDAWQWQAYVHLIVIFVLGMVSCMMTEAILKYIIRIPHSTTQGISYIIRRNLWFQLINTPLIALMICLYRHFIMSDLVESNKLSVSNFLETLLIIAFLSFAIGLYWRFKFRSKFLKAELEETRQLNERLQQMQVAEKSVATRAVSSTINHQPSAITLTGTTNETVTLQVSYLLYIEAVGNYVNICHLRDGDILIDILRATSKQMEENLQAFPMIVRCHRAFLVNLGQVEQIISKAGTMQLLMKHCQESIPVSRSHMAQIKKTIKENIRI